MISSLVFSLAILLFPLTPKGGSIGDTNVIEPKENYIYELEHWRVKEADSSNWQDDNSFDTTWIELSKYERTIVHGDWWAKTVVTISNAAPENKYFALFPDRIVSAYDVYWDGIYIWSNGVVSKTQNGETVGKYFGVFQIPKDLSRPGDHHITLHISNWNVNSKWENGQFFFGYYDSIIKLIYAWQIRIYFLLGIIFLALFLNIFLFFTSQKRPPYLLFGLICLISFSNLLSTYYWAIADVSNYYLDYRNVIVPITLFLIGIAFPAFFLYEFDFPYKKVALSIVALSNVVVSLLPKHPDDLTNYTFYLLASNVLLIAVWGITRKRQGSLPVLFGIGISGLISTLNFRFGVDHLTIFTSTIIICYTYILAKQFSLNEKVKQEALIRSIRLQNQLLKRSINPHYLLNSLTSIIVWLRKKPSTAIKLVEFLSNEFRIVSHISDLDKISMGLEVELCQTHLTIMSYRRRANFRLELRNVDLHEEIPPMIFHTLIENGITHSYENRTEGTFVLQRDLLPDGVRYTLSNDGDSHHDTESQTMGTGFKYVTARLEESYPGRWSFDYGTANNGFEVTIVVYNHVRKGI